jgi:hypothetical protein
MTKQLKRHIYREKVLSKNGFKKKDVSEAEKFDKKTSLL